MHLLPRMMHRGNYVGLTDTTARPVPGQEEPVCLTGKCSTDISEAGVQLKVEAGGASAKNPTKPMETQKSGGCGMGGRGKKYLRI